MPRLVSKHGSKMCRLTPRASHYGGKGGNDGTEEIGSAGHARLPPVFVSDVPEVSTNKKSKAPNWLSLRRLGLVAL